MLVAYRVKDRAVFLYGFAKSDRENISDEELLTAREVAAGWLAANSKRMARAIEENELQEVFGDDKGN